VKSVQATAALMAICMTMTALAACGNEEQDGASATASPGASAASGAAAGPKREISISIFDRGQVPTEEGSYESNRWTKWIDANSPAIVKWVPVARNEAQVKLNTLIASGSAPDLIWEYDRNYIAQLANQGAIQPIGEYVEKYSTTYKNYLKEHPELKPFITINDKLYAITSLRGEEAIANHGMWIRQDWLDKLGLKTPATVEELVDVARKFRDNDPDGNGKADTVPITFNGNGNLIMRSLFLTHETQWYLEGDRLQFGRINDRFADSLAFQKQLYEEGLIDKEFITDKNFQRSSQFFTTGKSGIFMGSWNMENMFMDLKKNVPDARMKALEPVASKYGKNGLYQETPANILVAFNASMKEDKMETAIKFLDWMLETGWRPLKYGEENVHYKMEGDIPKTIDAAVFRKEVSYAGEYAVVNKHGLKAEWFPVMAATDALSQEYAKEKAESLKVAMKNEFRRDIPFSPSLPELTQLLATLTPIAQQIEAKVITGGSAMSAQAGIEELRREWKRLGGENVERLVNDWYKENKEQLQ
jgi:putative aldouronate transport system substrate-binding protein